MTTPPNIDSLNKFFKRSFLFGKPPDFERGALHDDFLQCFYDELKLNSGILKASLSIEMAKRVELREIVLGWFFSFVNNSMDIFKPDGTHAVTPYIIDRAGNTLAHKPNNNPQPVYDDFNAFSADMAHVLDDMDAALGINDTMLKMKAEPKGDVIP